MKILATLTLTTLAAGLAFIVGGRRLPQPKGPQVTILKWPAEIREHRCWSEEPTELTDWYVCGRRVTLNWSQPKNWGLGARRFGDTGFSLEAGPLFLFVELEVAE